MQAAGVGAVLALATSPFHEPVYAASDGDHQNDGKSSTGYRRVVAGIVLRECGEAKG